MWAVDDVEQPAAHHHRAGNRNADEIGRSHPDVAEGRHGPGLRSADRSRWQLRLLDPRR
jgi:hypothetical protein